MLISGLLSNWKTNIVVLLNQLTEDDSCLYTYDADGNMTTKVNKNTSDTTTFVWDVENRLTELRKPSLIATYTYDALGRRMSKTVNGVTKKFGYDGEDLILEMNDQDSITANYTFGPGIDNPLMMNRAGESYYYMKDGLGSVTALTDNAGNVVHEYKYSVFGEIVEETGDSVENPFTFTSREMDRETGLMYYRARYYDPGMGRFLSEDPIGFNAGDANFYRYVFNSATGLTDPTGLYDIDVESVWDAMMGARNPNVNVMHITGGALNYIKNHPATYAFTSQLMSRMDKNSTGDFERLVMYGVGLQNVLKKPDQVTSQGTWLVGHTNLHAKWETDPCGNKNVSFSIRDDYDLEHDPGRGPVYNIIAHWITEPLWHGVFYGHKVYIGGGKLYAPIYADWSATFNALH